MAKKKKIESGLESLSDSTKKKSKIKKKIESTPLPDTLKSKNSLKTSLSDRKKKKDGTIQSIIKKNRTKNSLSDRTRKKNKDSLEVLKYVNIKKSKKKFVKKASTYSLFRKSLKNYVNSNGLRICGRGQFLRVSGSLWKLEGFKLKSADYENQIGFLVSEYYSIGDNGCIEPKQAKTDIRQQINDYVSERHLSFDWWHIKANHINDIYDYLEVLLPEGNYDVTVTDEHGNIVIFNSWNEFEGNIYEELKKDKKNGQLDSSNPPHLYFRECFVSDNTYKVIYTITNWSLPETYSKMELPEIPDTVLTGFDSERISKKGKEITDNEKVLIEKNKAKIEAYKETIQKELSELRGLLKEKIITYKEYKETQNELLDKLKNYE